MDIAQSRAAKKTRAHDRKTKDRPAPVISYREVIAAWMLIVLVGAAVFGTDFLWRDAATTCAPRIVAPRSHMSGAESAYDHGERLDRLDWDKDITTGATPAAASTPAPCQR